MVWLYLLMSKTLYNASYSFLELYTNICIL
nr:MAG TPA: hypothetical protein [Caudoviricetes sp.]